MFFLSSIIVDFDNYMIHLEFPLILDNVLLELPTLHDITKNVHLPKWYYITGLGLGVVHKIFNIFLLSVGNS